MYPLTRKAYKQLLDFGHVSTMCPEIDNSDPTKIKDIRKKLLIENSASYS